jgi:hypothetical protein
MQETGLGNFFLVAKIVNIIGRIGVLSWQEC